MGHFGLLCDRTVETSLSTAHSRAAVSQDMLPMAISLLRYLR